MAKEVFDKDIITETRPNNMAMDAQGIDLWDLDPKKINTPYALGPKAAASVKVVDGDECVIIKGSRYAHVFDNDTLRVDGNLTETVGGVCTQTYESGHTLTVTDFDNTDVIGTRNLTVTGANTETAATTSSAAPGGNWTTAGTKYTNTGFSMSYTGMSVTASAVSLSLQGLSTGITGASLSEKGFDMTKIKLAQKAGSLVQKIAAFLGISAPTKHDQQVNASIVLADEVVADKVIANDLYGKTNN